MYTIHATKKLLDRVKQPVVEPVGEPSTMLGNWYATAIFWKPQVALLVNERTLLPVFMPLVPASSLAKRFPDQLAQILEGLGMPIDFVFQEVAAMGDSTFAKTANRSVVGSMVDFTFLAEAARAHDAAGDLIALSVRTVATPCSPLDKGHGFPERELGAVVSSWQSG